jgi:hypothetical protein
MYQSNWQLRLESPLLIDFDIQRGLLRIVGSEGQPPARHRLTIQKDAANDRCLIRGTAGDHCYRENPGSTHGNPPGAVSQW